MPGRIKKNRFLTKTNLILAVITVGAGSSVGYYALKTDQTGIYYNKAFTNSANIFDLCRDEIGSK